MLSGGAINASTYQPLHPVPAVSSTILLDLRQSLQQAPDIDSAFALYGTVDHTPYSVSDSGGWSFTTNADGRNLHAFRADWAVAPADQGIRVIHYLSQTTTEFVAQWRGRIGRFSADPDNFANVDYYGWWPQTNANKRALFERPSNNGRYDYTWQRALPEGIEIEQGQNNYAFFGDSNLWNANVLAGAAPYLTTVHIKAGSTPTSTDGVMQIWIGDLKVCDQGDLPGGNEVFDRWEMPTIATLVPQNQSEYFWDVLVWIP